MQCGSQRSYFSHGSSVFFKIVPCFMAKWKHSYHTKMKVAAAGSAYMAE
jgi:hypothetical protein